MAPPRAAKVTVDTRIDPHDTEHTIRLYLARLEADAAGKPRTVESDAVSVGREEAKEILAFARDRETELSRQRYLTYLRTLPLAASKLGPDFLAPSRTSPAKLKGELSGAKGWTIVSYWACVSKFWKWRFERDGKDFPSYLRLKIAKRYCARKDESIVISREEVDQIADHTITPRDRAFVLTLYESGSRSGELLSLPLRDVTRSEHGGYSLHVDGKTGKRTISLFEGSVPALGAWLKDHPTSQDPDAPLWCGVQGTEGRLGQPLTYAGMSKIVRQAALRAGIKKKVNLHLFRHSRATAISQDPAISGAILEKFMGWQHGSPMAATYLHVSGREVEEAMARGLGVEKAAETSKPSTSLPIACRRCSWANDARSKYCAQCAGPLTLEAANGAEEGETERREMYKLLSRPEVRKFLVDALRRANSEAGPGTPPNPARPGGGA